jgi:Glycosyltransferase family 87
VQRRRARLSTQAWDVVPLVLAAVILGIIVARAFSDPSARDFETFYHGAELGWTRGDPWREVYWLQLPAVVLVLGPLTEVMSQSVGAWLVTLVNLVCAVGLAAAALWWLGARCARWFSWLVVIALIGWGALAGAIWWKQLNLPVLALALVGFVVAARRPWTAGLLIGLSIALKPLVLLLPVFLLFHRETRRTAVLAVGSAAAFTLAGLVVLAIGGGSISPFTYYRTFDDRTVQEFACNRVNASPTGFACRIMGIENFDVTRFVVLCGIAVLVALALGLLRGTKGTSLVVFAWACLLSPMVSPLEWAHYGVMLAPMFVVLAAQAWAERTRLELWFGLFVAYALSQIVWNPARSLPGLLEGGPESLDDVYRTMAVGAMAQFVLVAVALVATARTPRSAEQRHARGEPVDEVAATDGADLARAESTGDRYRAE